MGLQANLENLRAKPEHIRKRIAFWSSFGITAIIFVFWLASFSYLPSKATGVVTQAVGRAGAPAQSLIASVGSFFVDIKDLVWSPKKVTYSNIEVVPGK